VAGVPFVLCCGRWKYNHGAAESWDFWGPRLKNGVDQLSKVRFRNIHSFDVAEKGVVGNKLHSKEVYAGKGLFLALGKCEGFYFAWGFAFGFGLFVGNRQPLDIGGNILLAVAAVAA